MNTHLPLLHPHLSLSFFLSLFFNSLKTLNCLAMALNLIRQISALDWVDSLHSVYAYLTELLLILVGMKYQGLNTTLFTQHPALIILFLIAISLYGMVLALLRATSNQFQNIDRGLSWVCHVCGVVACQLLLLLLVSPLLSFIINASSILLLLIFIFCYHYLFPPSLPASEEQASEGPEPDLEAAPAPNP